MSEHDFKIDKKQIVQQNQNISFNDSKLGKIWSSIFGNSQQVELDADVGLDVVQISETENEEPQSKKASDNGKYPVKPDNPPPPFSELERFISAPKFADRYKTQTIDGKTIKYDSTGKKLSESVKLDEQNLTKTTFFDNEGKITCKVTVGENDKLESAEFYDKEGNLISSTNKDGETTSHNGSNVKLFFDPVRMRISGISELDQETGKVYRSLKFGQETAVTEYDTQTGEKISSIHINNENLLIKNVTSGYNYEYDSKSGKGYIYQDNKIKETIEYDSETGNVIKRTRDDFVREYDPKTGVEIRRTGIGSDGEKTISEYDSMTGKKIRVIQYQDGELLSTTEYFYDKITGNKIKEISSDLFGFRQETEYNPITGDAIKESIKKADGSYSWCEVDNLGWQKRGAFYNPDGSIDYRIDYELDSQTGQVTKVMTYDAENNIQSFITYEYDTKAGTIKRNLFSSDNRLTMEMDSATMSMIKLTKYNDDGVSNIIEYGAKRMTYFNSDGSISKKVEMNLKKNPLNNEPFYAITATEYSQDRNVCKICYYTSTDCTFEEDRWYLCSTKEFNNDGSIKNEESIGRPSQLFQQIKAFDGANTPAADLLPKSERTVAGKNSFNETINGVNYEVKYEDNKLKIKRNNGNEETIDLSEFSEYFVKSILMRVNSHALYKLAKEKTTIKWSSELKETGTGVFVTKENTICLNRSFVFDTFGHNNDDFVKIIGHEIGHLFDSIDDVEIAIKDLMDNPPINEENLSIDELLEKHGTRTFASRVDKNFINTLNKEFEKAFPIKNQENASLSSKERIQKEYLTDWDSNALYALTSIEEFFAEAYNLLTSGDCMSAALLCNYFPESLKLVKERIEKEQ